jgi:MoxR-like ATPase
MATAATFVLLQRVFHRYTSRQPLGPNLLSKFSRIMEMTDILSILQQLCSLGKPKAFDIFAFLFGCAPDVCCTALAQCHVTQWPGGPNGWMECLCWVSEVMPESTLLMRCFPLDAAVGYIVQLMEGPHTRGGALPQPSSEVIDQLQRYDLLFSAPDSPQAVILFGKQPLPYDARSSVSRDALERHLRRGLLSSAQPRPISNFGRAFPYSTTESDNITSTAELALLYLVGNLPEQNLELKLRLSCEEACRVAPTTAMSRSPLSLDRTLMFSGHPKLKDEVLRAKHTAACKQLFRDVQDEYNKKQMTPSRALDVLGYILPLIAHVSQQFGCEAVEPMQGPLADVLSRLYVTARPLPSCSFAYVTWLQAAPQTGCKSIVELLCGTTECPPPPELLADLASLQEILEQYVSLLRSYGASSEPAPVSGSASCFRSWRDLTLTQAGEIMKAIRHLSAQQETGLILWRHVPTVSVCVARLMLGVATFQVDEPGTLRQLLQHLEGFPSLKVLLEGQLEDCLHHIPPPSEDLGEMLIEREYTRPLLQAGRSAHSLVTDTSKGLADAATAKIQELVSDLARFCDPTYLSDDKIFSKLQRTPFAFFATLDHGALQRLNELVCASGGDDIGFEQALDRVYAVSRGALTWATAAMGASLLPKLDILTPSAKERLAELRSEAPALWQSVNLVASESTPGAYESALIYTQWLQEKVELRLQLQGAQGDHAQPHDRELVFGDVFSLPLWKEALRALGQDAQDENDVLLNELTFRPRAAGLVLGFLRHEDMHRAFRTWVVDGIDEESFRRHFYRGQSSNTEVKLIASAFWAFRIYRRNYMGRENSLDFDGLLQAIISAPEGEQQLSHVLKLRAETLHQIGELLGSKEAREDRLRHDEDVAFTFLRLTADGSSVLRSGASVELALRHLNDDTTKPLQCDLKVSPLGGAHERLAEDARRLDRAMLESVVSHINMKAKELGQCNPLPAGDDLVWLMKAMDALAREHAFGFVAPRRLLCFTLSRDALNKFRKALQAYMHVWRQFGASYFRPAASGALPAGFLAAMRYGYQEMALLEAALYREGGLRTQVNCFLDAGGHLPSDIVCTDISRLLQNANVTQIDFEEAIDVNLRALDRFLESAGGPTLTLAPSAFVSDFHTAPACSALTWVQLFQDVSKPLTALTLFQAILVGVERYGRNASSGDGYWPRRSDVHICGRSDAKSEDDLNADTRRLERFLEWTAYAPHERQDSNAEHKPLAFLLFPSSQDTELQIQTSVLLARRQMQLERAATHSQHGRRLIVITLHSEGSADATFTDPSLCKPLELVLQRLGGAHPVQVALSQQVEACRAGLTALLDKRNLKMNVVLEGAWGHLRGGKSHEIYVSAFGSTGTDPVPRRLRRPLRLSDSHSLSAFLAQFQLHPYKDVWIEAPGRSDPSSKGVAADSQCGRLAPLEDMLLQLLSYGKVHTGDGRSAWQPQGRLNLTFEIHWQDSKPKDAAALAADFPLVAACASVQTVRGVRELSFAVLPHTGPELSSAAEQERCPRWLGRARKLDPAFLASASNVPSLLWQLHRTARVAFWLFGGQCMPPQPDEIVARADMRGACALVTAPYDELRAARLYTHLLREGHAAPGDGSTAVFSEGYAVFPSLRKMAKREWPFVRLKQQAEGAPPHTLASYLDDAQAAGVLTHEYDVGVHATLAAGLEAIFGEGAVAMLTAKERGKFVLSPFVMLRLMVLAAHLALGLPIVLEGETGVGKTRLMKVFHQLVVFATGVADGQKPMRFEQLDIHPGLDDATLAAELRRRLADDVLEAHADESATPTWDMPPSLILFVDEVNCGPQSVIEILRGLVLDRQVAGIDGRRFRLHRSAWAVCACNPAGKSSRAQYSVEPLPASMEKVRWALDALSEIDVSYIVAERLRSWWPTAHRDNEFQSGLLKRVVGTILAGHRAADYFALQRRGTAPAVSLRDLDRLFQLADALSKFSPELLDRVEWSADTHLAAAQQHVHALVIATAMVYLLRIPQERRCEAARREHSPLLAAGLKGMAQCAQFFCQEMKLEERRAALPFTGLNETMLALFVYFCARVPLFLIGAPGTSKSLCLSLLVQSLLNQDLRAGSAVLSRAPVPNLYVLQCSPSLTPHRLLSTFRRARAWVDAGEQPLLVLEEMGLVTSARKVPAIKVLHAELDFEAAQPASQRVAFIGISNTFLDAAKMNRGGVITRERLGSEERSHIAKVAITGGFPQVPPPRAEEVAALLANQIYTAMCTSVAQSPLADTFGNRDFFSMLLRLWRNVSRDADTRQLRADAVSASLRLVEGVERAKKAVIAAWREASELYAEACDQFTTSSDTMLARALDRVSDQGGATALGAHGSAWSVTFHERPVLLITPLMPQEWWLTEMRRRGAEASPVGGSQDISDVYVLTAALPHVGTPDDNAEPILDLLSSKLELGGPIVVAAGPKTLTCLLDVINGHSIASDSALGERETRIARGGVSLAQRIHPSTRLVFVTTQASLPCWPDPIKQRLIKIQLASEQQAEAWSISLLQRCPIEPPQTPSKLFAYYRKKFYDAITNSPCNIDVDTLLMASSFEAQRTTTTSVVNIWSSHERHLRLWMRREVVSCLGLIRTECIHHIPADNSDSHLKSNAVVSDPMGPPGVNICHRVLVGLDRDRSAESRCKALLDTETSLASIYEWDMATTPAAAEMSEASDGCTVIITVPTPPRCIETVMKALDCVEEYQHDYGTKAAAMIIEVDGSMFTTQQLTVVMNAIFDMRLCRTWRGFVHLLVYAPLAIDDLFDQPLYMVPSWRVHACLGGETAIINEEPKLRDSRPATAAEKDLVRSTLTRLLRGFRCTHGIVGLVRVYDNDGPVQFCWPQVCLTRPLQQLLVNLVADGEEAELRIGEMDDADAVVALSKTDFEALFQQTATVSQSTVKRSATAPLTVSIIRSHPLPEHVANMAAHYIREKYIASADVALQNAAAGNVRLAIRPRAACEPTKVAELQHRVSELRLYCRMWSPTPDGWAKLNDSELRQAAVAYATLGGRYSEIAQNHSLEELITQWCHGHFCHVRRGSRNWCIEAPLEELADKVEAGLAQLLAAVEKRPVVIDLKERVDAQPLVKRWPHARKATLERVCRTLAENPADDVVLDQDTYTLTIHTNAMVLRERQRDLQRALEAATDAMKIWRIPVARGCYQLSVASGETIGIAAWLDPVTSRYMELSTISETGSFVAVERMQAEAYAQLRLGDHNDLAQQLEEQHGFIARVDRAAGDYDDETHVVVTKGDAKITFAMTSDEPTGGAADEEGREGNDNNERIWICAAAHRSDLESRLGMWSVAPCGTCFANFPADRGMFCENQESPHFTCRTDLNAAAMESIRPEKLGSAVVTQCTACSSSFDQYLMTKHLTKETCVAIDSAKREIQEVKLQQEYDRKLQQELSRRLKEEVALLQQMDAAQRAVYSHRQRICNEILNDKCPRCGQVFIYDGGCMAFACLRPACGSAFCGYCFEACGRDAHGHAAGCAYLRPEHGGLWAQNYGAVQVARRQKRIAEYVNQIADREIHNALIDALQNDVMNMGIALPGKR